MYRRAFLAAGLALFGFVTVACAADKADPNGTWKWTSNFGNQDIETTLKLKLEGEKLTGTITGRENNEMKIENGTFKNDEVAFDLNIERDDFKIKIKFKGKVEGDTIKGKIEFDREGQTNSFDWNAKREKKA